MAPLYTPEQQARIEIDRQLGAAGWAVQDRDEINLFAGRGVGVREFHDEGGLLTARRLFGVELPALLGELNEVLAV
jgi:hypothetical protein